MIGTMGIATEKTATQKNSRSLPGRNPRDIPFLMRNATAIDRMQRS